MLSLALLGCTWIDDATLAARLGKGGADDTGPVGHDSADSDDTDDSDDIDGDGHTSVAAGGDDCWDDDATVPDGFAPVNGFGALGAAEVHPGADDRYYDGIDADCDGLSDFDQDGDGFDIANPAYAPADGSGDDCYDGADVDVYPGDTTADPVHAPADVYPGADDAWYDGTDSNCDGADDHDQDGDGWVVGDECDDTDARIFPDASVEEVWYNDIDENCDGNRYDKDGDGYESALDGPGADCWDDDDNRPPEFEPMYGSAPLLAAEVNPGVVGGDTPYDGADADCAGDSDFDWDGDGDPTSDYADRDGFVGTDCDDGDPAVYLDAAETWYDGVDADCRGDNDYDADGDGFDADSVGGDDCDDTSATVSPAATETVGDGVDQNCNGSETCYDDDDDDGYLDATGDTRASTDTDCTDAYEGTSADATTDCDEASASDHPGATEIVGNGDDEDCDGGETCYEDDDNDGFLDATADTRASTDTDCADTYEGTNTDLTTDCDDASASDYPGATEIVGNSDDEDCDGVDACYTDADGDNYGTTVVIDGSSLSCTTGTGAPVSTDCNDASSTVYPGATETVADGIDQDCDSVDSCYTDNDGDNYGTAVVVDGSSLSCSTGTGAANDDDCNDASASIYPGSTETCNDVDDDCDGSIDEGLTLLYADADEDGYGTGTGDCANSGGATNGDDCDDANVGVYPGATELCDGEQNDCDDTAWTSASEDGLVSFVTTAGVWSDLSSSFSSATASNYSLAASGTYYFCAGTYYTKLVGSSDTVSVIGVYGAANTTLDNNTSLGATVAVTNGSVTLEGLTITGGHGASGYGGGLIANATATPSTPTVIVEDCVIEGNVANYGGGIAAYTYGWARISGTTIQDNTVAWNGGGAWVNAYGRLEILDGSSVNDNAAVDGGGIYLHAEAELTIEGSDIHDNSASDTAGGIYVNAGLATCDATSGVYANTAVDAGGGVYINQSTGEFTATNCDFTGTGDNTPDDVEIFDGSATYTSYPSYGATATFTCTLGICSPSSDP